MVLRTISLIKMTISTDPIFDISYKRLPLS
jgi:hypothetical protein